MVQLLGLRQIPDYQDQKSEVYKLSKEIEAAIKKDKVSKRLEPFMEDLKNNCEKPLSMGYDSLQEFDIKNIERNLNKIISDISALGLANSDSEAKTRIEKVKKSIQDFYPELKRRQSVTPKQFSKSEISQMQKLLKESGKDNQFGELKIISVMNLYNLIIEYSQRKGFEDLLRKYARDIAKDMETYYRNRIIFDADKDKLIYELNKVEIRIKILLLLYGTDMRAMNNAYERSYRR